MKPIAFSCEETLALAPTDIARQILDLSNWTEFKGFGPIPGVKVAEFVVHSACVVGSRIRVINTDGSSHVEEIVDWHLDRRLQLHLKEFSAPLSHFATLITETWEFERVGHETKVIRSCQLHPRSFLAWPFVWLISFMLKKAIARHLGQMRGRSAEGRLQS
jgi:hypothetical protein